MVGMGGGNAQSMLSSPVANAHVGTPELHGSYLTRVEKKSLNTQKWLGCVLYGNREKVPAWRRDRVRIVHASIPSASQPAHRRAKGCGHNHTSRETTTHEHKELIKSHPCPRSREDTGRVGLVDPSRDHIEASSPAIRIISPDLTTLANF